MATAKIETGNIKIEVSDDHVGMAVIGADSLLKACLKTPLLVVQVHGLDQETMAQSVRETFGGSAVLASGASISMTFGVPSRS